MIINSEFLIVGAIAAVILYGYHYWARSLEGEVRSADETPPEENISEKRARAVMHYRLELMRKDSVAIERQQAEERAIALVEDFSVSESIKVEKAIDAAKQGDSALTLSEKFEMTESDAELIVSIHGRKKKSLEDTVH